MTKGKWAVALLVLAVAVFSMGLMASGCSKKVGPPPAECDSDAACPPGQVCEGGRCVMKIAAPAPECASANDCPDGKICRNGKCVFECSGDTGCPAGYVCENNRCVSAACEVQVVNFEFDEYYLTAEAQAKLRANAACLKKKAPATITIEGHCDERGTAEYNLSLGQKRAQSVRDFLVDLGIEAAKLRVVSYGEERPVDARSNEAAWAKNRRAETVLR